MLAALTERGPDRRPRVVADITTTPASLELLQAVGKRVGATITGENLAAGDRKAHLVSRLQLLLQTGCLLLPRTAEAEALAEDLRAYELTPAQVAPEAIAAPVGRHDALMTALGLAVPPAPPVREKPTLIWR